MVSPPTRGWSAARAAEEAAWTGVPAYAGMVLADYLAILSGKWCPRLRGDGPPPSPKPSAPLRVSPPTRGWSLTVLDSPAAIVGVPAYAGMVPAERAHHVTVLGCPRLRGDGPLRITLATSGADGVPAYAGMVPSSAAPR